MKPLIDLDRFYEPTGRMEIKVSRRGVLTAAADAAEERRRSREGLPSYRIESLMDLDDGELSALCPIVNSKAKIDLKGDFVFAETLAAVDPIPLFPVKSPALFIFNQFNGGQTIAEIIDKTAAHTGWDAERSSRAVRTVFLKLCEVRVCEPGNPK